MHVCSQRSKLQCLCCDIQIPLSAIVASLIPPLRAFLHLNKNSYPYAALMGGSTLGQGQLPLHRPSGYHMRLHIDKGPSIRTPQTRIHFLTFLPRLLPVSCNLICSLKLVSLVCALLHASRSSPAAMEYLRPNSAMNQQSPILPMQEKEEWWLEGRPLHNASGAVLG